MAFGKLPGEVEQMTVRDARAVFEVWERRPPPHRALAMLLQAQTTWKPKEKWRPSPKFDLAAFARELGVSIRSPPPL